MLTGFTGHDDEADLGLVNMKGRLYDPTTGRFTTPDPFVQAAGWSQGFNRYSYAWNNPLKWIDPSGFDSDATGEATSCGPACFTVPYSGSTDDPLKAGSDAVFGYQFGNLGTGPGVGGAADYSLPTAVSVTTTPGMTSQDFAPNGETSAEAVEDRGIIAQMVADDLQRIWADRATPPVAIYQQVQARFILGTASGIPGLSTFVLGSMAMDPNASAASRAVSGVGAVFSAVAIAGSLSGVGAAQGFSATELGIVNEVKGIPLAQLRAAFEAGGAELNIGGRTILVDPGVPASGMTLFGENGFVLGREAFASDAELTKTLLHETYRLTTSQASAGVSGALATSETNAAFSFAERAFGAHF